MTSADSDAVTQDGDESMPNVSSNDGVTDDAVTEPGAKGSKIGEGAKDQDRVDKNSTPTDVLSVDAT